MPQVTSDQLKVVRAQIDTTNRQLAERQAELKKIEANYEVKLARYRELQAKVDAQRAGR